MKPSVSKLWLASKRICCPTRTVRVALGTRTRKSDMGGILEGKGPTTFTVTLVAFSRDPLKATTGMVWVPFTVPLGMVIFIVSKASPPSARKTVDGVNVTIGQKLVGVQRNATGRIVMFPEKPSSLTSPMVLLFEPPSWIIRKLGSASIPNPGCGTGLQMFVSTRLAKSDADPVGVVTR